MSSHFPNLHRFEVFLAANIAVTLGVNLGEGISTADEICLGDIYELDRQAIPKEIYINHIDSTERPCLVCATDRNTQGPEISLSAHHILLSSNGDRLELLTLECAGEIWVLPLTPMEKSHAYTLVQSAAEPPLKLLRDLMCLSFVRGTMITLANGRQKPIEQLGLGEMVLTRDHGAQKIRYIGRATMPAIGAFAPVIFPVGILENTGDLMISQNHRIFVYQRRHLSGMESSQYLVQARSLVDGQAAFIREGGFIDWFSLVFDRHEIIYAEGIPVESLMVNEATLTRLPADIAQDISQRFPGLRHVQHFGTEYIERHNPEPRPPLKRLISANRQPL